jgi:hypothetical protein
MTAAEFKAAKAALGVTWPQLARALGYGHHESLVRFANGSRPVPHLVAVALTAWLRHADLRAEAGL